MQFALNYSPAAAELYRRGAVHIDLFKCPDWPDLVQDAQAVCPAYVHFPLVTGAGLLEAVDWRAVDQLLAATDTPFINVHLRALPVDVPGVSDPPDKAGAARLIERMSADLRFLARRYGAERVIVENYPYGKRREDCMALAVDPDVFHILLDQSGCGLLLDLSHARISARYLGLDERDYIARFPLDRLRELHVTGIQPVNGVPTDHMPFTEADWEMFDWFVGLIRDGQAPQPQIVACEYGGISDKFSWRTDPAVIAEQIPRMVEALRALPERGG